MFGYKSLVQITNASSLVLIFIFSFEILVFHVLSLIVATLEC